MGLGYGKLNENGTLQSSQVKLTGFVSLDNFELKETGVYFEYYLPADADGKYKQDKLKIQAELAQQIEDAKPKVVTMRQARLALLEADLLGIISDTINSGADIAMKIEWEYATEIKRDWPSLIAIATELNMTSDDLDALFLRASEL